MGSTPAGTGPGHGDGDLGADHRDGRRLRGDPEGLHPGVPTAVPAGHADDDGAAATRRQHWMRSEEHTSELQSLMRISYAVFCLKKKKTKHTANIRIEHNRHNTA